MPDEIASVFKSEKSKQNFGTKAEKAEEAKANEFEKVQVIRPNARPRSSISRASRVPELSSAYLQKKNMCICLMPIAVAVHHKEKTSPTLIQQFVKQIEARRTRGTE